MVSEIHSRATKIAPYVEPAKCCARTCRGGRASGSGSPLVRPSLSSTGLGGGRTRRAQRSPSDREVVGHRTVEPQAVIEDVDRVPVSRLRSSGAWTLACLPDGTSPPSHGGVIRHRHVRLVVPSWRPGFYLDGLQLSSDFLSAPRSASIPSSWERDRLPAAEQDQFARWAETVPTVSGLPPAGAALTRLDRDAVPRAGRGAGRPARPGARGRRSRP